MAQWTSHWTSKEIVVKDFYISFSPMGSNQNEAYVDLSETVAQQVSEESVYAVVVGRPDGFFDFLREIIGIPRRFEFVMTTNQVIQRIGSPSEQIFATSQMSGLNTITVGLVRPLKKLAVAILFMLISAYQATTLNIDPVTFEQKYDIDWIWAAIFIALLLRSLYLLFIEKDYTISLSESGDAVVNFTVSPSFLESRNTIISLTELNRLPMIFRVMKAK